MVFIQIQIILYVCVAHAIYNNNAVWSEYVRLITFSSIHFCAMINIGVTIKWLYAIFIDWQVVWKFPIETKSIGFWQLFSCDSVICSLDAAK